MHFNQCAHLTLVYEVITDYVVPFESFWVRHSPRALLTYHDNAASRPAPAVTTVLWAARMAQRPPLPLTSCPDFRQEFYLTLNQQWETI